MASVLISNTYHYHTYNSCGMRRLSIYYVTSLIPIGILSYFKYQQTIRGNKFSQAFLYTNFYIFL